MERKLEVVLFLPSAEFMSEGEILRCHSDMSFKMVSFQTFKSVSEALLMLYLICFQGVV